MPKITKLVCFGTEKEGVGLPQDHLAPFFTLGCCLLCLGVSEKFSSSVVCMRLPGKGA